MKRLERGIYDLENPVKQYRIENRKTKEIRFIFSRSAQDACQECGWYIADCYVKITGN
jgi:hypothetical protein